MKQSCRCAPNWSVSVRAMFQLSNGRRPVLGKIPCLDLQALLASSCDTLAIITSGPCMRSQARMPSDAASLWKAAVRNWSDPGVSGPIAAERA